MHYINRFGVTRAAEGLLLSTHNKLLFFRVRK